MPNQGDNVKLESDERAAAEKAAAEEQKKKDIAAVTRGLTDQTTINSYHLQEKRPRGGGREGNKALLRVG